MSDSGTYRCRSWRRRAIIKRCPGHAGCCLGATTAQDLQRRFDRRGFAVAHRTRPLRHAGEKRGERNGTVGGLNRAVESMFLVALPGYVRQPRRGRRWARACKGEVLVDFEEFTSRLLEWVVWWNTCHHPGPLKGKFPLEAWETDPTPLCEIGADELWMFTVEDDGRIRVVSTRGIRFRNRDYVGAWMTGRAGEKVRVRFMPHHDQRIEVFDAELVRRHWRARPVRAGGAGVSSVGQFPPRTSRDGPWGCWRGDRRGHGDVDRASRSPWRQSFPGRREGGRERQAGEEAALSNPCSTPSVAVATARTAPVRNILWHRGSSPEPPGAFRARAGSRPGTDFG
ncbi:Mu transposase C-terminal domain-containing protein [Streptomyces sp. NPDC056661]|uniref:Mu transposase C-terminal domain-containing protein n=1 Tax=Streptomyces sp. NPDC056661 TaxID=3345898 RepID=UPI00367A7131